MNKNIKIVLVVLTTILLFVIGGYLILKDINYENQQKGYKEKTYSDIEEEGIEGFSNIKEDVDVKINVSSGELKLTTKPNFKVGEIFKYRTTSRSMGESVTSENFYIVKKIERIKGIDNYVILGSITQLPNPETGKVLHTNIKLTTYVYKETGYIPKILMEIEEIHNTTIEGDAASMSGNGMYATWMLALKENLKWKQNITMNVGGEEFSGEEEYKVVGVETINGRNCFKVETMSSIKLPGGTSQKIQFKEELWIDVYNRILVKSKGKFGNLATEETELIDLIE